MADSSDSLSEQTTETVQEENESYVDGALAILEEEKDVTTDKEEEKCKELNFMRTCARCLKCFSDTNEEPKLLPCLHSVCESCIVPVVSDEGDTSVEQVQLTCPQCKLPYSASDVHTNVHVQQVLAKEVKLNETPVEDEVSIHECTGCEEKETGTSFCVNCTEWLCEQCVIAHKRVKVTKDHKIVPKEEAPTSSESSMQAECVLFCKQHLQEKLMFFCEKCDILTCRDCQLLEHKDHSYQFLDVAADTFKTKLGEHSTTMHELMNRFQQVTTLINNRMAQVKNQHANAVKLITDQAERLKLELIAHTKNLLQKTKTESETVLHTLVRESSEVEKIIAKYQHIFNFIGDISKDATNMAMLSAKPSILKECNRVYTTPIKANSFKKQFILHYKHDVQFLINNVHRLGTIYVESKIGGNSSNRPPQQPPQQQPRSEPHPPPSYDIHSQIAGALDREKTRRQQMLQQLQRAANFNPNANVQQGMNTNLPKIQQSQIPTILSHMRMNLQQQNNGWQNQQAMMRPNPPPQMNIQPRSYNHQQEQQPFQPMRLQHRPVAQSNNFAQMPQPGPISGQNTTYLRMSMPNQDQQLPPQPTRPQPPPLVRNHGGMTPPNSGRPSSTGSAGTSSTSRPSSNESFTHQNMMSVKRERRSSCDNDCIITSAKVKGERGQAPPCAGTTPQTTPAPRSSPLSPAVPTSNGAAEPSTSLQQKSPPLNNHEADKHLDEVLQNLPFELGETFQDIDDRLLSDTNLNKELSTRAPAPPKPVIQSKGKNGMTTKFPDMSFSDPNEDYCACCHNGGEVLCCESCPRVFHLQCHIPPFSAVPSGAFVCTLCSTNENIKISSPVPEEMLGAGSKRKAPGGLSDQEIKVCERLMLELFCDTNSVAFHEPVSKQVPNYYKIIQIPMDFTTIKCKLSRQHFNHYNCVEDFLADVKQVFYNCATYNQETSEVGKAGNEVRLLFEQLVMKYLPHYSRLSREYPARIPVENNGSGDPKRSKVDEEEGVVHIA